MPNFNKLVDARQTVIEMMRDRKYDIDEYFDENDNYKFEFNSEKMFNPQSLKLIIFNSLKNEKVQVLFYEKKIGIDILKNIVNDMNDQNIKHTILIVRHKITSFAKKEIINLSSKKYYFEIFLENEMLYNITKHEIVPQHILLSDNEAKQVIDCYGKSFYLPKIYDTDAICKYYDGKVGNVFKIIRSSSIYYRVVIKDPKK